jgi:mono/diheme cytochrome c family protein
MFSSATIALAQDGKAIFDAACAPCHRIGGGRLVGPDLAGINEKRPQDWLVRYIKSEEALVKSGDKTALALREEYKMPMPDQALSDAQIKATLAHIKTVEAGGATAPEAGKLGAAAPSAPASEPQPGEIRLGKDLFEGSVRFANGGPSCNACHHVTGDGVLGGGILASDLTSAFSRLGPEGLRAIIRNAPFPVMRVAYPGDGLSEDETSALIAFLQKAEQEHARLTAKEWGWRLFGAGVGGVIVLAGLAGLAGRSQKKRCVNQDIYDRQVRSQ